MALPGSGAISLNDVNVELGRGGTTQISMGETAVRTLFGIPTGAIDMASGLGKANRVAINFVVNSATLLNDTYNIKDAVGASYVAGKTDVTVSVTAFGILGSTALTTLDTGTGWATGDTIRIINYGKILGRGGDGGYGGYYTGSASAAPGIGQPGGSAIRISGGSTTLENYGTIGGGGGGGGGAPWGHVVTNDGTYNIATLQLGANGGGGAGYPQGNLGGLTNNYAGGSTNANQTNGGTGQGININLPSNLDKSYGGTGGASGVDGGAGTSQYVHNGLAYDIRPWASAGGGGGLGASGGVGGGVSTNLNSYTDPDVTITAGAVAGANGKAIKFAGGSVTITTGSTGLIGGLGT